MWRCRCQHRHSCMVISDDNKFHSHRDATCLHEECATNLIVAYLVSLCIDVDAVVARKLRRCRHRWWWSFSVPLLLCHPILLEVAPRNPQIPLPPRRNWGCLLPLPPSVHSHLELSTMRKKRSATALDSFAIVLALYSNDLLHDIDDVDEL